MTTVHACDKSRLELTGFVPFGPPQLRTEPAHLLATTEEHVSASVPLLLYWYSGTAVWIYQTEETGE